LAGTGRKKDSGGGDGVGTTAVGTGWDGDKILRIGWGWGQNILPCHSLHSISLKLVPFESLDAVSYSPSIVTVAVSVAVCEIFNAKEWRHLENQVRVIQGY